MITIFSPNSNSVEIVRVCEATYKETITKKKFCLGHQIGDEVIKPTFTICNTKTASFNRCNSV